MRFHARMIYAQKVSKLCQPYRSIFFFSTFSIKVLLSQYYFLFLRCNLKYSNMQTATALNQFQRQVVNMMANVDEAQQMEISHLLANYFAQKAFDAADELWNGGMIEERTIEEWKQEHMRTPYHGC